MKKFKKLFFAAFLIPGVLSAALQWDTTAVMLQPTPDQSTIDAVFPFKNTGPDPVSILSLDASCSCLSPSSVTGVYDAGQSGVLKVRFNIGSKLGTVVEHVTVHTTDKANEKVNLRLTINIPVVFKIEPEFLIWDQGGPADTREAYFYDFTGKGLKPTTVYSTDANFTAVLVPELDQKRYAIRVTPGSTDAEIGTSIYMDVDMGGGKIRKVKILGIVKAPGHDRVRVSD
ncbi:MAG TPA: DUF1573 domain-containing protein [Opitutaceae bacterium]|jgi:hypothetical protein|nr:DUF1573 domain-containing protein [Opitutaceae bacterium]